MVNYIDDSELIDIAVAPGTGFFSDYTLENETYNDLFANGDTASFVKSYRKSTSLLYKNWGAAKFPSSFTHTFRCMITDSEPTVGEAVLVIWEVGTAPATYSFYRHGGADCIQNTGDEPRGLILLYNFNKGEPAGHRISLHSLTSGGFYSASVTNLNTNVWIYCKIEKTSNSATFSTSYDNFLTTYQTVTVNTIPTQQFLYHALAGRGQRPSTEGGCETGYYNALCWGSVDITDMVMTP